MDEAKLHRPLVRYTQGMSRESLVFITGVLLFLIPNLGIPEDWKYAAYILMSVVLMIVGYSLRHSAFIRRIEREGGERHADSFVEQRGQPEVRPETKYE